MIYYNSQTKSFLLSGKNYSYCMYINRAGLLRHLYWSKKIGAAMSRYRYASHKIVKGALHLQGMPCARKVYGR